MANMHPVGWGAIKKLAETKGFDGIVPSADNTYDFGSSSLRFKSAYVGGQIFAGKPSTGAYKGSSIGDGGAELWRDDGIPYIDFKSDYLTDFDVRIQKTATHGLDLLVGGSASIVRAFRAQASGNLSLINNKLLFGTLDSEDTNLYREAANKLKTDGTFNAASLQSNAIEIADSKGLNAFPTVLKTIRFFDDFLGYNAANFRKAETDGYADMVEKAGVGRIITGSTSDNEYYILSNAFIDLGSAYEVEAKLALGSTTSIHAGLYIYADSNNYIVSGVHTTYDTAYFENVIVDGGLLLNYGGTTPLDTLYHRFKIVEDTTNIKFYIDGSLDAVAGAEVHPSGMAKIGFYCKTLTAAARWVKFDWIRAEQDR